KASSPPAPRAGTEVPATADPSGGSARSSLALGSIGSVIDTALGYLHDLYASWQTQVHEPSRREGARQPRIDAEREREVERRQGSGAAIRPPVEQGVAIVRDHQAGQTSPRPVDRSQGQGVRIVEDHLAPARPVASRREPGAPGSRVDADG